VPPDPSERKILDLVGVPCPVNWARAKAALEMVAPGGIVEVLTDDPRAPRDIPVAAEMEGYAVLSVERHGPLARIVIER
jgi:TusA-related sulfurtransferase